MKISIVIPTFNEEDNILIIYDRIIKLFKWQLVKYDYEIIFIDNFSTDTTRKVIENLNKIDPNVKAIFNYKNFGFNNSCYYGVQQGTGDCTVLLFADMQDPPEVIPRFVDEWEKGNSIVVGVKSKSKEFFIMYQIRCLFYKLLKLIGSINHIENYTGFGLYDKSFINVLKQINDNYPYLRGIVAEFGNDIKTVEYKQEKRMHGKSAFNFFGLYDLAMLGITSYSKVLLRLSTMIGFIMSLISLFFGVWTIIMKIIFWNEFQFGLAGLSIALFFMGSLILFFIGLLGEYILNINTRTINRPLIIEEKRIGEFNYDTK